MFKKNVIKKIVAIILIILVFYVTILLGSDFGINALGIFLDVPSFTFLIVPTMCVMVLADSFQDYFRAFKFSIGGNTDYTTKELESTKKAVKLNSVVLIVIGMSGSIVGSMLMLNNLDDPSRIGPRMAVAMIVLFYALIGVVINIIIGHKVDKELIYRKK